MLTPNQAKLAKRTLAFLQATKEAKLSSFRQGAEDRTLLTKCDGTKILTTPEVIDTLHKADLISLQGGVIQLTDQGQAKLVRMETPDDPHAAQHRNVSRRQIKMNGEDHTVALNLHESPLQRLHTRKTKSGKPWLDSEQVEAGERLRRDFTIGHLMQKVSSNWDFSSGGNRKSGAGGKAEISDSAIDARQRLERALECLGPDLATVLTDVCCFLKGLESVEREQRWPPRSAKLMLRTGLDLLARHYGTRSGVGNHSA